MFASTVAPFHSAHFLIREPFEVYLAKGKLHLTSHQLADFRESPVLFHRKQLGLIPDEDRPAFLMGRAAHTLILEGRAEYERRYAFGGPTNRAGRAFDRRSKTWRTWAETQGKPALTDAQAALNEQLYAAVHSHPVASHLLVEGQAEGVVRGEYHGLLCQSRIDWLHPAKGIVDLKTCDNLTWFEADARRFGYTHQLAFYRAVLAQAAGQELPVHLIAVEKREPFRCGVWRLSEDVLAVARQDNEEAMDRLLRCRQLDQWPTGYEDMRVFDHV